MGRRTNAPGGSRNPELWGAGRVAGLPLSPSHVSQAPTASGSVPNSGRKAMPRTDQVSVPGEGGSQQGSKQTPEGVYYTWGCVIELTW